MGGQRLLFVKLLILFVGRSSAQHCDLSTTAQVRAGNLGQTSDFNWLGVIHVPLHDEDKIHIAMTGIVLIKAEYALANADDLVKIPQQAFKLDSKAMFLVARNTPWSTKLKSFVTHPEYEYSTFNTIALVELNLDDVDDFPLNPICIPTGETFNTSRYLYLTGFTDENQKMEKVIYNIQYLDKEACEEFYNRAGLSSQKRTPSAYLCGYATSNVSQCVWDNGMALVSNVTGYFYLIGFGIHGPGCAAPARFIDLFPYFSWINSITTPENMYDDAGYRRKKDGNKEDDEFIPIHELFTVNGSRRMAAAVYKQEFERYPHFKIRPTSGGKAILIIPFNNTWEQYKNACKKPKEHLYTEVFELKAPGQTGVANYKLSWYDLQNTVCSCIRITVDSVAQSEAILTFREEFNFLEGTQMNRQNTYKTPEEIFKIFSGLKRVVKKKYRTEKNKWEPNLKLLKPASITADDVFSKKVLSYDLHIKFEFSNKARLHFEIFAEPGPMDPNRTFTTTPEPTTTEPPILEPTTPELTTLEPTTTTEVKKRRNNLRRRTKSRIQTKEKSHWGIVSQADIKSKAADVSLMADVAEVEETESAARSEGVPGAVVVACWLVSACLRRAFFIH